MTEQKVDFFIGIAPSTIYVRNELHLYKKIIVSKISDVNTPSTTYGTNSHISSSPKLGLGLEFEFTFTFYIQLNYIKATCILLISAWSLRPSKIQLAVDTAVVHYMH